MLAVEIKSIENINKYDCDIIIIPTIFSSSKNSLKVDFSLMKTNKKIALNVAYILACGYYTAIKYRYLCAANHKSAT